MATDIRLQVSFRGHRKRKKLTHILGKGATDHLIDLWIAVAINKPTGILEGMDDLDISLEAGWEGNPEEFVSALIKVGFLEKDASGFYRLHDWEEHQQWIIKEPLRKEKSRKANEKKYGKDSLNDPTRTPKNENEESPSPFPSLPFPTSPNPSFPKKKKEPAPEISFPPALTSPAFKKAWDEWRQYRKEKRKPMSPTQEQKLLNRLAEFGEEWAINRIDQAIANGWQGLIFSEDKPGATEETGTMEDELIKIYGPNGGTGRG